MAVVKDAWNVKLVRPDTKCTDCLKYPCFKGIENCKSSFSAYGCRYFKSKW